jgi:N-acetylmuramoyl-L-alanine amidase
MQHTPGTPLPIVDRPSPNHGERIGVERPDMLLLHYTGMANAEVALERLCAPESKVSTHYVVLEDGGIVRCVPEERRAWHAGISSWQGIDDVNSHAIGIEIVNPGHDEGYPGFPAAQIDAVIALAGDIVRRQRIVAARVLAHSDVAPQRKRDPGEKFPWKALHAAGIGHWIEPAVAGLPGSRLHPGAGGPAVEVLQQSLRRYGYGIDVTGIYDPLTVAVVSAFQRHFRPARVDGVADVSTRKTLDDLLISLSPPVAQK